VLIQHLVKRRNKILIHTSRIKTKIKSFEYHLYQRLINIDETVLSMKLPRPTHNGVMSNSTHPIAMAALLIVESDLLASGIDRERKLVVAITSKA
jgi:hypothetical protein